VIARDILQVSKVLFGLSVLRHGLPILLFCSHEIHYFLEKFRVVPFGTPSTAAAAAAAAASSCCLLFSVLRSFF
jgi:hypothetical protein